MTEDAVTATDPERLEDREIREAEARGDHAAAHMWRVIKANTDRAPELGPQQKQLLRTLLNPPGGSA